MNLRRWTLVKGDRVYQKIPREDQDAIIAVTGIGKWGKKGGEGRMVGENR